MGGVIKPETIEEMIKGMSNKQLVDWILDEFVKPLLKTKMFGSLVYAAIKKEVDGRYWG